MALGTILPFWPALVFTYLEPLALVLGYRDALQDPSRFALKQLPTGTPSTFTPQPDSTLVLSYTLGNVYLVLAGCAIVCTAITRDPRVVKWYLFVIACGDLGHVYASYKVMGDTMWNFNEYNDMMWGNVAGSAFLHVNRGLTLMGLFGRIGGRS